MNSKILEDIRKNKFSLDCFEITLTQNTSNNPKTYKGPGIIYQENDGLIKFKMFPEEEVELTEYNIFSDLPALGEMFSDEDFFNMNALDFKNHEWFSEKIQLAKSISSKVNRMIIEGQIRHLEQRQIYQKDFTESSCEIILFGEFDFQYNKREMIKKVREDNETELSVLNHILFESQGFKIVIHKETYGCMLSIKTENSNFDDYKLERIIESLQFVFANRFEWTIKETTHGKLEKLSIREKKVNSNDSKHFSPINTSMISRDPESFWVLFDKYFSYIVEYKVEDKFHPVSRLVNTIISSSDSYFEAYALTLGVAVESLINSEFKFIDKSRLHNAELTKPISDFIDYIKCYECKIVSLQKRIDGLMSSFQQTRPIDRLHFLEFNNIIEEPLITNWKKLRNKYAHFKVNDNTDYQILFDMCESVTVLFYKLVFQLINYSGPFTDYTQKGYPIVEFKFRKFQ